MLLFVSCDKNKIGKPCSVPFNRFNNTPLGDSFVFNNKYLWDKKKTKFYVFFIANNHYAEFEDSVIKIANEWLQPKKKIFIITDNRSESDIRINLDNSSDSGYNSYIGNEAKDILESKHTMSLYHLYLKNNAEIRRVVLHEFGHALGLFHELSNPIAKIEWNRPVLDSYFLSVYGWNSNQVQENIIDSVPYTKYSNFDPQSVMIYRIPKNLTTNLKHDIEWPLYLSKNDQKFIKENY